MHIPIKGNEIEPQGMQEATRNVLEECRMVLPGIQALFGFQLIAVFNRSFSTILSPAEQRIHLLALGMSSLAIALVMGPAAYHRQVHPQAVSKRHLRVSSVMLTLGMFPLWLAIVIDFYLVARVICGNVPLAATLAGIVAGVFAGLWFIFPRVARLHHQGDVR